MSFRKAQAAKIGGKFLSYGESGSGKSTFQLTFPRVACIDSETGVAHYEGKDITLNNGHTYNNLVLVDNTSDLDELEEDLDAFLDGEYDGQIDTLSIDSESKFYATMQIGATEVEERRARKKGGDVDDAGISVKQWGRIKIINMKLQQAKIDLSSKGTHVVSVAQEVEIKDDDGKNNWTDARLNYLLNPGHESENVGGSLYWNSSSGTCYSGSGNATTNCNFTTTGLKDEARNMIGDTLWYLGGTSDYASASNGLASHWYTYERGTTVYSGRDTSFVGKIGLMYPSDYGYATSGGSTKDRNACLNKELYNWGGSSFSDCKNNDWLYESSYAQWTLSPHASRSYRVFSVSSSGCVYGFARYSYGVRPVAFLKSNIKIEDGDGSSSNPYILQS